MNYYNDKKRYGIFQDKEKELDSGTPENEKDATTEKEGKEEEEKEAAPVTNGETEPKVENGESTPAPEDGKKPKKEKVCQTRSSSEISRCMSNLHSEVFIACCVHLTLLTRSMSWTGKEEMVAPVDQFQPKGQT